MFSTIHKIPTWAKKKFKAAWHCFKSSCYYDEIMNWEGQGTASSKCGKANSIDVYSIMSGLLHFLQGFRVAQWKHRGIGIYGTLYYFFALAYKPNNCSGFLLEYKPLLSHPWIMLL